MHDLVLIRHGQSQWNLENRFTGWVDVDLSPRGVSEAREAGITLKEHNYQFDIALTSTLTRCIRTLDIVLQELDHPELPIQKDWRINERHYGALQGLNKLEMMAKHGAEQVHLWRRSFTVRPPGLSAAGAEQFDANKRYSHIEVPRTESLYDTYLRVVEYWDDVLAPLLHKGQRILLVGHGNSLRALVKHLDNISDDDISQLNIPTGVPLVYQLDTSLIPQRHFYLADQDKLDVAVAEVRNQTSQ